MKFLNNDDDFYNDENNKKKNLVTNIFHFLWVLKNDKWKQEENHDKNILLW
jgi:hypothetical protein